MLKPFLVLAILANVIFVVTSQDATWSNSDEDGNWNHKRRNCKTNEIYVDCPLTVCVPKNCSEVGYPVACVDLPPNGKCPVKPGCICKEGYVWNDKGICIPMKKCPSCGGDPNAVSGCGNCNLLCSNYDKGPIMCPAICNINGCDCRKGYILDEITGKCVLPKDCTKICTMPNEVFDICPAPCPPRRCDVDDRTIDCIPPPKPGDPLCEPGCRCADGYYRNYKGICVTWDQCPKCTKPNEVFDVCPAPCPPQRCDINPAAVLCLPSPQPGDPECEPGCRCIDGYVKNADGVCIPRDQCPPTCGENEVYSDCINGGCQAKNCSQAGFPVPCVKPKKCIKGCLCKDGYLRNSKGRCIPKEECPSCGGDPNAHPGCGVNCGKHCSNLNNSSVICPDICNLNGCDCDKGFVFDDNIKKCVRPKDCTAICNKPNEEYNPCPYDCPPRTCEYLDKVVICPIIDPEPPCVGACRCKNGFFRNANKDCVTEEDCRKCPGAHEYYACAGACDNVCANIHKQNQTHCPIINIKCNEMCYCEKGYARAKNNTCIPISCCDAPQCPINERYEENPSSLCTPQYCDELGYDLECPNPDIPDEPACVCVHGYVRNEYGVCIPERDCPSCGGDPNKVAGCGVYCNNKCSDIGEETQSCIQMCYPNGCDCRKGYYLDDITGLCVLPKDCSPPCGKNEVYSGCINGGCQAKNCSQVGFPVPCVDPIKCKKGCLCKDGYLRNKNGVCIPRQECPSCGGDPNAHPGCGVNCGKHCSDYLGSPLACPKICKVNGCDCNEGYYFDDNTKKCVLPEKCSPVCKINEVYSNCINGGCEVKSCYQLGKPIPCEPIDPKKCIEGCLCKEGYLRADNGICVPEKECKYQCRKPHQVYDSCPSSCPPDTCESIGKIYECPFISTNKSLQQCEPNCVCEKGYYKNKIGECISKADCLKCVGPHEFFSCGGACDNVCATLSQQNQTNCPIVNIVCNNKCYCEKNFARAKNNTCIPISQCHEHQCGVNEIYDPAPSLCEPQTCEDLNGPIRCLTSKKGCIGKPGCVCINGFVRDKKGNCIAKTKCPQYKELVCGKNEIPSSCVNGGCDKRNCTQLNQPTLCIDPICCIKGCVCKYGYLRNDDGVCVPTEKCPCKSKCGQNEVPSDCINGGCDKRNCSQIGQPDICIDPIRCISGCICREGYLRNNDGLCVPIDQCLPVCGKNEVYSTCIQSECRPMNCSQLGHSLPCPRIDPKYCIKGCICENGYVKDDNDHVCIPKEKCSSCGGDPNAVSGCGTNCNRHCSSIGQPPKPCPFICSINGCDCKENYYLDDNTGKCVLPKHCSKCKN
nr:Zon4A-L [Andraca theae]